MLKNIFKKITARASRTVANIYPKGVGMIDVKELMTTANIDELNYKADVYFKQFVDRSFIES